MTYLIIHSGYNTVTIALYRQEKLAAYSLDKKQVSSLLANTIHDILREHAVKLDTLAFVGAHSGPAPFTTLRSSLAAVHGMNFAHPVPLVAVSGLDAFCTYNQESTLLLNAFCDDIYYGYYNKTTGSVTKGCMHIDDFLKQDLPALPATFVGNGTQLYAARIRLAQPHIHISAAEYPLEASIDQIAQYARQLWNEKRTVDQIAPEYMKQYSARVALTS